ncbi:MFS transporter [Nocardioides astragali]|uniref:MFS transporter n=1 Tax=Nocardioides astragali TaxID=1776736 RepID=A0ABW2N864_9ACTN|nr:MFS transporter [Nocardioides astragali]
MTRSHQRAALGWSWAALALNGYGILVFGAAVPVMLRSGVWGLTREDYALLGSITLAGMLVGAFAAGNLADRRGRRPALLTSVGVIACGMLACGLAPTSTTFGLGRFVVGVGAGLMLPTAAALVSEFAPDGRKYLYQGAVFGGVGLGGALGAVIALATHDLTSFRFLFLCGAAPALVLLPAIYRGVPESEEYLRARGSGTPATTSTSWRLLLSSDYRTRTLLFWGTTFMSLLLLFGAFTWLPVMMNNAGYDLGSSLAFLLTLSLGVIAGSLSSSWLADRIGKRHVIIGSFAGTAIAFCLVGGAPPPVIGYVLVAAIGAGAVNAQFLINGYVAASYPTMHRGTALGSTLSVGRLGGVIGPLYGGSLLRDDWSSAIPFYGFAVPAVVAALLTVAIPVEQVRQWESV